MYKTSTLNFLRTLSCTLGGCLLFFFSASAQTNSRTEDLSSQRYLALMLLNLTSADDRGPEPEIITRGRQNGMNALYLTIPWDKVYASPNDAPKWAKYDEQIKIATDLGMKIALRIHVGRHSSRIKGFWEVSDSQFNQSGLPLLAGYQDTFFGFDNKPVLDKAIAFVKEATNRYKHLQTSNHLLFVSVTNTPTQEGEYPSGIIRDGSDQPAVYDYSKSMEKGFQAWLKTNYKKIQRLNFLWGSSYATFENVPAPSTPWDPASAFRQRSGKDWYIYRHLIFKSYVNQMIDAVKSVDNSIRFISDYGSVFDILSVSRGTLGFKDLNQKADGIKVNDDLVSHDHRWSVDILKSNMPSDFIIANELFVNQNFDTAIHLKQINENFEHGANIVAVLISTTASMQKSEPFLKQASASWLTKPLTPVIYSEGVDYRLSAAVEKGGPLNIIYGEWSRKAYANPSSPKPVAVRLHEDILEPDYWNDATNRVPYVFRPVPMQIIPVNKEFTYKLPTDTFSDVDGSVVRMEADALPSWLRFEGGQLRGRPTALGDFRITVRGIDDEGGISDAFFTIRVDPKENSNRPPTVSSNFSNQLVAINQPFTLTIPKNAFVDTDGTITRLEASELPSWLSYSNGLLSGTPVSLGESRIILKAFDNLTAFVETYFTIKVVEPQFLNAPPFASNTLPIKIAQVNQPFSYLLPTAIFGDPDGYISAIALQNRPSWLDFSMNVLSGTPTEEGEYRIIVRAYDNAGAYVEIPLILKVEIPRIRFELARGGRKIDQQVIRTLTNGAVIPADSLPSALNIFVYGNFEYDQVRFDLSGPYRKKSVTTTFPYALYEGDDGFAPYVGRYTLTITAGRADSAVITNSIQFSISKGDSLNIAKDIAEWQFYPNPVESTFNIKLPVPQPSGPVRYSLISTSGKRMAIPPTYVTSSDNLLNMDLSALGLASGIYFIRLENEDGLLKQFRIFKK